MGVGGKDLKEFSEDPITALLFLHWKCQKAQLHTKAPSLTSPALPLAGQTPPTAVLGS